MKGVIALSLLVALALSAGATTVYRWVDANGVVHYADRPHPGAVTIDLEAPLPVSAAPVEIARVAGAASGAQAAAPAPRYVLRILAPANGTTLRPDNHAVRVQVSVKPPLSAGARLQYRLDGKVTGAATIATALMLHDVYRGTHRLTVVVLAPGGRTAASTGAVFYVRQHSALFNPP